MANFYKCDDCGGIVLEMGAPAEPCENASKKLLVANSTDGAQEKHVPVADMQYGHVRIRVGSAPHPMLPEHHIEWIYIKTSYGGIYCNLEVGDPPEALFNVKPEEVLEVYEYCNLHGLWKAPTPVFDWDFDQNTVACSAEFSAGCVNPSGM